MSSTPTIKQTAWISIVPQVAFISFLVWIWDFFNADTPLLNGALTYMAFSFALRKFIPKDHEQGMMLVKQGKYLEAIPFFHKSYDFFRKYNWIDKYRYLIMLSSSKMSYKEMALNNIAFCYGQSENGMKSKEYYEKALQEFPESGVAQSALRFFTSAGKSNASNENL